MTVPSASMSRIVLIDGPGSGLAHLRGRVGANPGRPSRRAVSRGGR